MSSRRSIACESHVTARRSAVPRDPHGDRLVAPRGRPASRERGGDRVGARLDDEPGRAVVDDLERPAGVGRRHDRLLGEERLVRHHPEVLVDRRVVDGEAARVEVGELLLGDAAGEARRGRSASDSSRSRSGPSPTITTSSPAARPPRSAGRCAWPGRAGRRRGRSRRTRRSGRRAPAAGAAAPRPRSRSSARAASATLPRGREHLARLAERDLVEPLDAAAGARDPRADSPELAELGAVELVRLAELVHEPDDLVRVADAVGRELGRDTRSIGAPVGLGRGRASRQRNACVSTRSPGYHLNGTETMSASWPRARSCRDELVGEDLDAAARERHLRPADGDSHRRPRNSRFPREPLPLGSRARAARATPRQAGTPRESELRLSHVRATIA